MVDFHRYRIAIFHVHVNQQHRQHRITSHVAGDECADLTNYMGGLELLNCDLYVPTSIWQDGGLVW